jgi:signal transduction histidine kinase
VTLRTKLLLAQAPLLAALIGIGVVGSLTATMLGQGSQTILRDNFRSVLAAQRMMESVERMDSGALFLVAGERERGIAQARASQEVFERELGVQEGNITEPDEAEATHALRESWRRYLDCFARLAAHTERRALRETYFQEVLPAFEQVKRGADAILALNQDAMVRKSEEARRRSERSLTLLAAVSALGLLLALWAAAAFTTRLLRPLSVLGHAARRIGAGDLAARALVEGKDEIGSLAGDFNAMADRLQRYRDSSLGELLKAQAASQATIDSLSDPVLVLLVDGHLQQSNRAAETHLGLRVETGLVGLDPAIRAAVERLRLHVADGKGAYQPRGLEEALRLVTPEGERHYLPRAAPLFADEGDLSGATIILQDVTRLLRFEELRNNLVATVAHEFRTPLTSLRMAIHLMIEQRVGPLTEKQADLVYAAREDCERLQGTVDELLDLSRIQAGRMELRTQPTEIETMVRRAFEPLRGAAEQRGVELRCDVVPGLGHVAADPERIQLVLANLLANAIRHSPSGESVVVRADVAGARARIEVVDRGPGVPPEHRQAVFEKYFRVPGATGDGAGLGLFIAREIVQAHGGEIGVSEGPGGGAAFWFTLPLACEA